jgi:hypothetical protein
VWTAPRRHRLMKLRVGDVVTAKRGDQAVTGRVSRVEADGFWLESPDGMSYRSGLASREPDRSEQSDSEG